MDMMQYYLSENFGLGDGSETVVAWQLDKLHEGVPIDLIIPQDMRWIMLGRLDHEHDAVRKLHEPMCMNKHESTNRT